MSNGLFSRSDHNPLLTASEPPMPASAVPNPGAVEIDGELLLLLRIDLRRGISQIRLARSANGVDNWRINPSPLLEPDLPGPPPHPWGIPLLSRLRSPASRSTPTSVGNTRPR